MMTQTHILIGLAAFGRRGGGVRNLAAIAGGVVPDAAIFALYAVEKAKGTPESTIWNDVYFDSPFWQDILAWQNSAPLWLLLLVLAYVAKKKSLKLDRVATLMMVFAGSCLVHVVCDFPLHVEDAHRHLYPISNWRFHSPVSYWNPNHFGVQAAICEAFLGIGLSVGMWLRFNVLTARTLIALLLTGYVAVPVWFAIQFMNSGS